MPIRNKLTILIKLRTNRDSQPKSIPGIFFGNGTGKARISAANIAQGSIASQPKATMIENLGEEIAEPVTAVPSPNMLSKKLEILAFNAVIAG